MWQTQEGAEQRAGHLAILSYKTSQTRSVQCGITQGFPCGGSGTPDVQQNGFPGNLGREWGKNQPRAHPHRHPPSLPLSGMVHHFGLLLNYHLVTLKPYRWERFLSGAARDRANAKNFGMEKPQVLSIFSIICSRGGNPAGTSPLTPCSPVQTARWFVLGGF